MASSKTMETINPIEIIMDTAVSHFCILRLMKENAKRKGEIFTKVEEQESVSEPPMRFVGSPTTYRLYNECEMCGQNKNWCVCVSIREATEKADDV